MFHSCTHVCIAFDAQACDKADHRFGRLAERVTRAAVHGNDTGRHIVCFPGELGCLYHCALMPTNLITLPHFSVSSAISLPKSEGVLASGVEPKSMNRAMSLGSVRPALIALLRLSIISGGVFLGAPRPNHVLVS